MRSFGKSLALLGAVGLFAVAAPAYAGCGDATVSKMSGWQTQGNHDNSFDESIVGMWNVQFLVGGNVIDFGYQQWHGDGTEFMNSGGRSPATQNFCMGVWQRTAPNHYKLNHWALTYDSTGTFTGRANIREDVALGNGGATFSGSFTIDIYDPKNVHVAQVAAGTIKGTRITVNSGI